MSFVIECPNCGPRPSTDFRYGGEVRPAADPASAPEVEARRLWMRRNVARRPARALVPPRRLPALADDHPQHPDEHRGADEPRLRRNRRSRYARATASHRRSSARACARSRAASSTTAGAASTACPATAPNCLLEVDGESDVRSCLCVARDGMTAKRQGAWPSVERDPLALNDRMHWALPVGLLLQDADQAEVGVAEGRADHPPGRRPRPGQPDGRARATSSASHRHPDVLVIGLGPGRARRRRSAPRAAGKRVFAVDENEPGWKLPPGPVKEAVARLRRRGPPRAADRARAVAHRDRHLRGPRGAGDRPGPAAHGAPERDRRRDRRVRAEHRVRRATRCPASSSAAAPRASSAAHGDPASATTRSMLGGTHEVADAHRRAARAGHRRSRRSCCPPAPTTPASTARASSRGTVQEAHGARPSTPSPSRWQAAAPSDHVRRARALRRASRRRRTCCARPTASPSGRAGDVVAPGPLEQVDRRRAQGRRRGGAAASASSCPRSAPKTQALRLRRLRLHLLRRHRRRDRALGQGGLPLDRAAQALHDGDDGRVPGPALPRPAARAQRALLARRRRRISRPRRRRARRRDRCGSRRPSRATATTSSGARACTTRTSRSARASCGPASGSASSTTASPASPT